MTKERDSRIDTLYTIGIFLVLIGHSHPNDWSLFDGTFYVNIIAFIYTFHMALFFFIAGYLLENSESINKLGYGKWIRNKAVHLLTPYIVLSALAFFPKYYLEYHDIPDLFTFITIIIKPRAGVWGHFWFIPVLFMWYVLFGLWKSFVNKKNRKIMTGIIFICSVILYFLPLNTDWFALADFKEACVFICTGIFVRQTALNKWGGVFRKIPKIRGIFIIITSVSLNLLLMQVESSCAFFDLLSALAMILACWNLAVLIKGNSFTQWISMHNFTIYIYSWLFQSVVMAVCGVLGLRWYITSLLMFIAGFVLPVIMIMTYEKFKKIHNYLFELILGVK